MRFGILFLACTAIACGDSFGTDGAGGGGNLPDASVGGAAGAGTTTSGGEGGRSTTGGSAGSGNGTGGAQDGGTAGGGGGIGGKAGSGGAAGRGGSAGRGGASGSGGASGGTAGASGASADGGTDAGSVTCVTDEDCMLVDDCCLGCIAQKKGFPVPPCDRVCITSPCDGLKIAGVRCSGGLCVLAPDCDASHVTCKSAPPTCPAGQLPSIKGACWSGECVKASACLTVKDCAACDPERYLCGAESGRGGSSHRCVDIPPLCSNDRTCACAGSFVCVPPHDSCAVTGTGADLKFECGCASCAK